MLGGTQSLHTNSYDEALALPTEEAVRIALRTQQVIAHETGVTNTVDPLGGSYFVEKLTDEMEAAAYDYFARIDELGGMVAAIEQNFPQREIADAAFDYQAKLQSKRARSWSASTSSRSTTSEQIPTLKIDPEHERRQVARVRSDAPGPGRRQGRVDPRRAAGPQAGARGHEPDGPDPRMRAGQGDRRRDGRGDAGGVRAPTPRRPSTEAPAQVWARRNA